MLPKIPFLTPLADEIFLALGKIVGVGTERYATLTKSVNSMINSLTLLNNTNSTYIKNAGGIVMKIKNKLASLGYDFEKVKPKITTLLGTDVDTAKKLSGALNMETDSDFLRLLEGLKNLVDTQTDNLRNENIKKFIMEHHKDLASIWDNLYELRNWHDNIWKFQREFAKQYGLNLDDDALLYRTNYMLRRYPVSIRYRIVDKNTGELIAELPEPVGENEGDLKSFIKKMAKRELTIDEFVKDFSIPANVNRNDLLPVVHFEPVLPAEWREALNVAKQLELKKMLGGRSMELTKLIEQYRRNPTADLMPRELNELGFELDPMKLMSGYVYSHKAKFSRLIWDKFIQDIKKTLTPMEYSSFVDSTTFKKIQSIYWKTALPETIPVDTIQRMFRTLFGKESGDRLYIGYIRPLMLTYPVFRYLAFNVGNTIANRMQLYITLLSKLKNPANLNKAFGVAEDILQDNDFKRLLGKIYQGELTDNIFLNELSTVMDRKRFAAELSQMAFLYHPEVKSQWFSKAISDVTEKGLSLSGFSHIESLNRLTAYIASMLDNGVAEEEIKNILLNRIKTLDRMGITTDLYYKHSLAMDTTRGANFIYNPFYQIPIERWLESLGDLGRQSLILRRFGLHAIYDTLFRQDPIKALPKILPYMLVTFGVGAVPTIGAIYAIGDVVFPGMRLTVADKIRSIFGNEKDGEMIMDALNYGILGSALEIDLTRKIGFMDNVIGALSGKDSRQTLDRLLEFMFGVNYATVSTAIRRAHSDLVDLIGKDAIKKSPEILEYIALPQFVLNIIDGYNTVKLGRKETIGGTPIYFQFTPEEVYIKSFLSLPNAKYKKALDNYLYRKQQQSILNRQAGLIFDETHKLLNEYPHFNQVLNTILSSSLSEAVVRTGMRQVTNIIIGLYNTTNPDLIPYKVKLNELYTKYKELHKNKSITFYDFVRAFMQSMRSKITVGVSF